MNKPATTDPLKPDLVKADSANPDSVNPDSVNPDSVNPDSVKPDSVNPDSAKPDSVKPDSVKPDSANPDSVEADLAEPDALEIVTFGCRLNAYESEVMRKNARLAGLKKTTIINTCAVTAEAERQARQAIRRARRDKPHAQIIVTGCAAQINPSDYANMPEVDRVLGNREKMQVESFGADQSEPVRVNDIMSLKETAAHMVGGFEGRARAFVQVQNGCDHRCTFCIIPYGRGPSRSVPIGEIVTQIRNLVENGYKEIVLTGVDITSYGPDLPGQPTLGQMIRRLLALIPELPRLRLSSIDCIEMDETLFAVIAEEKRLMPHLHLSLQAGDDLILKRMRRRHLRAAAISLCNRLRSVRPDIVFGADLIAGFPTETEEMFQNTVRLVEECDLTWLHVFPYSERPGTPAARIPNKVESRIRKQRAARLREIGTIAEARFLQKQVGQRQKVLVEKTGIGRNEYFAPVQLPDDQIADGQLCDVMITGIQGRMLTGERCKARNQ